MTNMILIDNNDCCDLEFIDGFDNENSTFNSSTEELNIEFTYYPTELIAEFKQSVENATATLFWSYMYIMGFGLTATLAVCGIHTTHQALFIYKDD